MKYLISIAISAFLVLSMGMGTAMAASPNKAEGAKVSHVVHVKHGRHHHGHAMHRHHHHHHLVHHHHHHHHNMCKAHRCR